MVLNWWIAGWQTLRSSPSELFLRKDVLKICRKFTGEHPCQSEKQTVCVSNGGKNQVKIK